MFDPNYPYVDMAHLQREDWGLRIYGDVEQDIPPILLFSESGTGNMPEPRGQGFTMTVYVDCDLGGDCVTHRSIIVFSIFLNGAPIYWRSAKQHSCEVRNFGYEFTAMKKAVEYACGHRYKIKMMGIPCEDPDFVYGDNKLVLSNTIVPASSD